MEKTRMEAEDGAVEEYAARTSSRYKQEFPWADFGAMEVSLAIQRSYGAQNAALTRFFEALGSVRSSGRYTLLRILYFSDDARLTQMEIVNEMNVTSPNVTYLIDALEKEGLVVRTPHPTDRRATLVELTPTGIESCARMVPAMAEFMKAMSKGFSEGEKALFYEFLNRFRANAEEYALEE